MGFHFPVLLFGNHCVIMSPFKQDHKLENGRGTDGIIVKAINQKLG